MCERYRDFLVSRIFERNDYGSVESLLDAIKQVSEIDQSNDWREMKRAGNVLAEKAPMRDSGYLLKYEDVPAFLEAECAAFYATDNHVAFTLYDQSGNSETTSGVIDITGAGLAFGFEGYSDSYSIDGYGAPLVIERHEGSVRLIVYADINSEEPTHTIALDGARNEAYLAKVGQQ